MALYRFAKPERQPKYSGDGEEAQYLIGPIKRTGQTGADAPVYAGEVVAAEDLPGCPPFADGQRIEVLNAGEDGHFTLTIGGKRAAHLTTRQSQAGNTFLKGDAIEPWPGEFLVFKLGPDGKWVAKGWQSRVLLVFDPPQVVEGAALPAPTRGDSFDTLHTEQQPAPVHTNSEGQALPF